MSPLVELLRRAQQEKIPCLVVRGHAVILYQVPRFTRDLDFVIPEEAVDRWLEFLQRLSYHVYQRTAAFIQLEPTTPVVCRPLI